MLANVAKWVAGAVLIVLASIGYTELPTEEANAATTTPAIAYACWFEPKGDGTFEGVCGDAGTRPGDALDDMRLELPEGIDPAIVSRWRSLGAYDAPEDGCECLYVPVPRGFGA